MNESLTISVPDESDVGIILLNENFNHFKVLN